MIFQASDQVPEPPDGGKWVDVLRWLVAVFDDDSDILPFVAGVLAYCLKYGGLTAKQGKSIERIFANAVEHWQAEYLDCQQIETEADLIAQAKGSTIQ